MTSAIHDGHVAGRSLVRRDAPPRAREPKIEVVGLTARYGAREAITGVTLSIPARTVTAIIGPSGCGKSTLLRCLNRLHEATPGASMSGRILLDGRDLRAEDPIVVRRRVGMVFQRPNPFPTMSVRDNVLAGFRLTGVRPRFPEEVVERALRRAALWDEVKDALDRPGTSLSGGQQQRLCIARALAVEPEVLLMDEPCSALDPLATARIEELIREVAPEVTVVIVTHNMQQAARVSERTAFLYLGRLVEVGDTATVFTRPAERLTEEYITGRFG